MGGRCSTSSSTRRWGALFAVDTSCGFSLELVFCIVFFCCWWAMIAPREGGEVLYFEVDVPVGLLATDTSYAIQVLSINYVLSISEFLLRA